MSLVPKEVDKLLDANARNNILDLLVRMREANHKAKEASVKWDEQSSYLNMKYVHLDMIDRIKRRQENLILAGHFDTWHFWQREAVRCASSITAEMHSRMLLGS